METYQDIKTFLDAHESIEGTLTLDRASMEHPSQIANENADRYVRSLGFAGLGLQWQDLGKVQAIDLLTKMLHRSLAYKVEMMPLKTAKHVSERFISQFNPRNSIYLSNGDIAENSASWNSITKSTMEMALVVMDEKTIGIVCVEDED